MSHPQHILTEYEYRALHNHFVKTHRCSTTEEHEKAMRNVNDEERQMVAGLYQELREQYGLHPVRLGRNNQIVWAKATPVYVLPPADASIRSPELARKYMRANFGRIGQDVECSWGDIQDEKELLCSVNR